nr:hypothetical protein [Tanacetum cinerariifolium]
MQTQTSNTLHNAIMEAGGKDRPPMLAPGNYVQWKSRIKRCIDTKLNHELIHYCLKNLPYKYTWADKVVLVFEGIDNDIYSTVDACPNTCEMWKAIKRKCTSRDGESLESYYSRFYKMMNELVRNQCDVTNHQVNVQFLLQLQPEWQRIVNVVGARENVGTPVVQKSGIQCYNCKEYGHVARECQKPKRANDATYHKKKMLLCKQEEAGFQLNAEQADWKDDTDDESEDHELEAHYMYMARLQEVTPDPADNSGPIFDPEPLQQVSNNDNYNVFAIESEHPEQSKSTHDTYPIEQDEHNVIIDSLDMSYERKQADQDDDDDDLANERDLLAFLIEKLKCK